MFWKKKNKETFVTPDEFLNHMTHYKERAESICDNLLFLKTESIKQLSSFVEFITTTKIESLRGEELRSKIVEAQDRHNRIVQLYHLINMYDISHIPKFVELKKELFRVITVTKDMLDAIEEELVNKCENY